MRIITIRTVSDLADVSGRVEMLRERVVNATRMCEGLTDQVRIARLEACKRALEEYMSARIVLQADE